MIVYAFAEVMSTGDGFLVSFASPTDAVYYAVDIQRRHRDYNAEAAEERKLVVRIGIHGGRELEVVLSKEETTALAQSPTANLEAYSLFLQGRHLLARRDGDSVERALHRFQQAVDLDPHFAQAHAEPRHLHSR